jgi:hypothetical protein
MRVTVFIIDRAGIVPFPLCVERHISGLGQDILHAFRVKGSEFVHQAEIDVVLEPGLVCSIVLARVEHLNYVLFASLLHR